MLNNAKEVAFELLYKRKGSEDVTVDTGGCCEQLQPQYRSNGPATSGHAATASRESHDPARETNSLRFALAWPNLQYVATKITKVTSQGGSNDRQQQRRIYQ